MGDLRAWGWFENASAPHHREAMAGALRVVAGEAAAPLQPPHSFDDYFAILGTRGSAKVALGFITFVSSVPGVAAEFSTPGAVHGIRL